MSESEQLRATVAELARRIEQLESAGAQAAQRDDAPFQRRDFLRKAAVVGGGAAVLAAGRVLPAAATDGNSMTIGMNSISGNTVGTRLGYSSLGGGTKAGFAVFDTASSVPSSLLLPAIAGIGDGSPFTAGVYGHGSVVGMVAEGGSTGLKVSVSNTQIKLQRSGSVVSPVGRTDASEGSVVFDDDNNLWFCTASSVSSNPGTWRKLAGQDTAGSLHPLATPYRIYDSRPGQPPLSGTKTPMTNAITRTLTATAAGVPTTATSLLANITVVVNSGTSGWFGAFGSGSWPGNASLNWSATGQVINNTVFTALSGGTFKVYCGLPGGGNVDIIIDVVAYYL